MLEAGIKGRAGEVVTESLCAKNMGSGELMVYATPALVALAEKAAWMSVSGHLEDGMGSVGTHMALDHLSASPLGMEVWCESELIKVDGRKLTFKFECFDKAGKIGEGTHERFIVNNNKFMEKTRGKSVN